MSAPLRPTREPDWAAHPAGGWSEFRAARARFRATLAEQSALVRLERAWRLPARGSIDGREQGPALRRFGDVQSRAHGHAKDISEPQAGLPPP